MTWRGARLPLLDVLVLVLVVAAAPGAWLWLDVSRPAPGTSPSAPVPSATPTVELSVAPSAASPAATDFLPTPTPVAVYGNGEWASVGSLPRSLWGAGAALLPDGRVLIVGGATGPDSKSAIAATALFDPRKGTWAPGMPMLQARAYPMVAVLADGSVLVAGGSRNNKPLDSAELYFPSDGLGTWQAAGRMDEPRTHGTMTLLRDGRVLLTGGGVSGLPSYAASATAEVYDPKQGTWTPAAPMHVARSLQAATLLPDGSVLVTGGSSVYYRQGTVSASAEIFDPVHNAWHEVAGMSLPRYAHAMLTLADGRVLVAGGWKTTAASDPSVASAEIYNPKTNIWEAAGPMSDARAQFRMVLLRDGRALAIGGVAAAARGLTSADLYDPAARRWTATGQLPVGVYWPIAVALADGRVLVAGGAQNKTATETTDATAVYTAPAP